MIDNESKPNTAQPREGAPYLSADQFAAEMEKIALSCMSYGPEGYKFTPSEELARFYFTYISREPADAPSPAKVAQEGEQSAAARDVLAERRRQLEREGWTPEHDDKYQKKELRTAALCYMRAEDITTPGVLPGAWPWPANWWKPTTDRCNLVKAGALILAEIERVDRAAVRATSTDGEKGGAS